MQVMQAYIFKYLCFGFGFSPYFTQIPYFNLRKQRSSLDIEIQRNSRTRVQLPADHQ